MSKQIVDIVEDYLNSIVLDEDVVSFSDDGVYTTIGIADTKYLRSKRYIDVDNITYVAEDVTNNTFKVKGILASPAKVIIPNPYYFHGTPYDVNIQLSDIKDYKEKYPFLYLYEILRDKKVGDPESMTARRADIVLVLLDSAKMKWASDKHYSEVIDRLSKFLDVFETEMGVYPMFNHTELGDFDRYPHANFGEYIKNKGKDSSIFDDVLSGIEIRLTLPVITNLGCV